MEQLGGLDPRLIQLVMSDPEIMRIISNPSNMQAMQSVLADPSSASQHMNNSELQYLMQRMQSLDLGAQGASGSGFSAPQASSTSSSSASSGQVINVTTSSHFNNILAGAGKTLVVVDFSAAWCGPCRHIAPIFQEMARTYRNDAIFCKVDVDKVRDLAARLKIQAMPTFHFYRENKMLEEFRGADAGRLGKVVDKFVAEAETPVLPAAKKSPYKSFPLKMEELVTFDSAKFEVIIDKISEFSDKLPEDSSGRLSESDADSLKSLVSICKDRTTHHINPLGNVHFELLEKLLSWPAELLPPVLNLLRVSVLHPSFAEKAVQEVEKGEKGFFHRILALISSSSIDVNSLTLLRTLCNMFKRLSVARLLVKQTEAVLNSINCFSTAETKSVIRLAFVSVLINYSITFLHNCPDSTDIGTSAAKIQCLSAVHEVLQSCESNSKLAYRALIVTGSLVFGDSTTKSLAVTLGVPDTVANIAKALSGDEAIAEVSSDLQKCWHSED